jgi:hypothetical protein
MTPRLNIDLEFTLPSKLKRDKAHAFYEGLGFEASNATVTVFVATSTELHRPVRSSQPSHVPSVSAVPGSDVDAMKVVPGYWIRMSAHVATESQL